MTDIRDKIRKLLAMAEHAGGNEAEMKNAMKMASDLMMRHGIERDQLREEAPKVIHSEAYVAEREFHHDLAIAAGILCGCKTLHWRKTTRKVKFVGRPENVEGAYDIYVFMCLQMEMFYKGALPRGMSQKVRAEYRRTFKAAFARRVWERAWDIISEQPKATGTALMIIDHRNMLLAEAQADIEGVKVRNPKPIREGNGTYAGIVAGDKADLNRKLQPEIRRIA